MTEQGSERERTIYEQDLSEALAAARDRIEELEGYLARKGARRDPLERRIEKLEEVLREALDWLTMDMPKSAAQELRNALTEHDSTEQKSAPGEEGAQGTNRDE